MGTFSAPFTPCVEAGWRLAFEHWGHGYATEAARLALGYGFGTLALPEIVSFTSATNLRSRAVMKRLGMRRDPAEDFDYPSFPGRSSAAKAHALPAERESGHYHRSLNLVRRARSGSVMFDHASTHR
jgi:RimJ/RimL family protein N-acetyltransferase